jgi:Transposase DDE domain
MERELWKVLYELLVQLDKGWGKWRYAAADVLAAYLWAVVHDRPTRWGADRSNWPAELVPVSLPPQWTLSRRLRKPATVQLMLQVEEHLQGLLVVGCYWVWKIDGKALAVSGVSKDPDVGYGRGAGGSQKGYKFHALWGEGPMPVAWGLAPINVSEKTMARHLIASSPGTGYLLGDKQYDANHLYDAAAAAGYQLVVRKTKHRGRGGLGHRPQSQFRLRSIELLTKPFGQMLYGQRRKIESSFGTLTSFGGGLAPLPAWVRRFHRVRDWVHAKLLIAGVRWLIQHGRATTAFA